MVATERETWGPELRGGRSPRRRSLTRTVLVTLLLVAALALAYGAGAALYASAQMDDVEVDDLAPALTSPIHVLVVGTDRREDMTEEQIRELHTGRAEGVRADTIFIMTIGWNATGLLAIPRDLQVTRCDGSVGRINAAIAIDGADCLAETVRSVSGIPISRYLEVDFLGFDDIVDAVGGVEMCLDEPIADADAGIDLPAGCQRLVGRDALGYVRVRKIDDDLQRIQRQQEFLKALADEIVSPSVILNPPRFYGTAGRVGAALTADDGTGPIDLARVGLGMRQLAAGVSLIVARTAVQSKSEESALPA
jgi:LCP family protein required for cell wall assembly